jgi:hypothetical protein
VFRGSVPFSRDRDATWLKRETRPCGGFLVWGCRVSA